MNELNNELYNRINQIRLDKYSVDQGLMLNSLVGALTGITAWADDNGKVSAVDVVDAVEQAFAKNAVKVDY